jgi:ParB family chromosome partitioning protein
MSSVNDMMGKLRAAEPTEVDISSIDVKPQARKKFEDENHTLQGLADTIKAHGVLQPVVLRPLGGGRYELVAGERRLRAAKLAGLTKIPCRIRQRSESESALVQAVENIQRKDLEPIEEATMLKQALEQLNGDRAALLREIGKKEAWLTQRLNLLDLPPQAQSLIDEGLTTDVTTLNNVRQLARKDPAAADRLVDDARKTPAGGAQLRAKSEAAKNEAKGKANPSKAASAAPGGGTKPTVATPRDRSAETPGAAAVYTGGAGIGGAGVFPAPPMKPHEKAITSLVEAVRKPGADAVKLLASISAPDRELLEQHAKAYFEKGRQSTDLVPGILAGLARNEFGKAPVEFFNLTAFLLAQSKAEKMTIDAVLAAIATAST